MDKQELARLIADTGLTSDVLSREAQQIVLQLSALAEQEIAWGRETIAADLERYSQQAEALLDRLEKLAPVVNIGVADGNATYVVVGQNNGWALVMWVWGGLDNYEDSFGWLLYAPWEHVQEMARRERGLGELFARKQAELASANVEQALVEVA